LIVLRLLKDLLVLKCTTQTPQRLKKKLNPLQNITWLIQMTKLKILLKLENLSNGLKITSDQDGSSMLKKKDHLKTRSLEEKSDQRYLTSKINQELTHKLLLMKSLLKRLIKKLLLKKLKKQKKPKKLRKLLIRINLKKN